MKIEFVPSFWESLDRMNSWKYKLKEKYYWVRALFFPYTVIKPRHLPRTWIDKSEVLPHMMFEILERFVEEECSPGIVNWDGTEYHRAARLKMDELLKWWNEVYIPYIKRKNPYINNIYSEIEKINKKYNIVFLEDPPDKEDAQKYKDLFKQLNDFEESISITLEEKMKEIIDLKDFLWT